MAQTTKRSIFESSALSTKIKSANVKLFPEGALGYLIGPTLAMLANSILSSYYNQYMTDVLKIGSWGSFGKIFFTWLPLFSVIFVVLGNILVGRLLDRNPTKVGKARPLILLSVPVSVLALLVLFILVPNPEGITQSKQILAMVIIAIGYNLWFGFAYPLYYTPHAALVSLSTRSSKDRSLLATISNATSLAAIGASQMILPFCLGLLFNRQMDVTKLPIGSVPMYDGGKIVGYKLGDAIIYDQSASYHAWMVFVIALIILTFIGALIEYYFTRERVTEETITKGSGDDKKVVLPMKDQMRICFNDKFWWIMIIFFFMYQLGGMMKNVSQLYYCAANFTNDTGAYGLDIGGTFSGTIGIVGSVPTALGMVIAWPLSNKIGKGKTILFGSLISVTGGIIGLFAGGNFIVALVAFVVKAFGSTPSMYLSLALLADILDHQEAMHGKRTDGFTMMIYGAIMAGMTGIATAIMNGVLAGLGVGTEGFSYHDASTALTFIFFGGETICYLVIAIIFLFMGVEKFSKFDHKAIIIDQRAKAEAEGKEYIEPSKRLMMEEAEAEAQLEEARKAELKQKCEKKGLDYLEQEKIYQDKKAEKEAKAKAKKAQQEEKAKLAQQAKEDKFNSLTPNKQAEIAEKIKQKEQVKAKKEAEALAEFNNLRAQMGKTEI